MTKKRTTKSRKEAPPRHFVPNTILSIEAGKGLYPLFWPKHKEGEFQTRLVPLLQHGIKYKFGFSVPAVSIRRLDEEINTDPDAFVILLRERPMFAGKVPPRSDLVGNASDWVKKRGIAHQEIKHPGDGSSLLWIPSRHRKEVKRLKVVRHWTPLEYVLVTLSYVVQANFEQFLTLPDVYDMLESVRAQHPSFMKDVAYDTLKDTASVAALADCLKVLVREGCCIKDLHLILEVIIRHGDPRMKGEKWAELAKLHLRLEPDESRIPAGIQRKVFAESSNLLSLPVK